MLTVDVFSFIYLAITRQQRFCAKLERIRSMEDSALSKMHPSVGARITSGFRGKMQKKINTNSSEDRAIWYCKVGSSTKFKNHHLSLSTYQRRKKKEKKMFLSYALTLGDGNQW